MTKMLIMWGQCHSGLFSFCKFDFVTCLALFPTAIAQHYQWSIRGRSVGKGMCTDVTMVCYCWLCFVFECKAEQNKWHTFSILQAI